MTDDQAKHAQETLMKLVKKYKSMRQFARLIMEDVSDVSKWKQGYKTISTRCIVSIARLHPEIRPYDLNPDWFPEDCRITFVKQLSRKQ